MVVAVGSFVLANSMRTPEAQVRRYLDYLAQGNASAATAMVDPGVANDERVFLTDEVMASATSLLDVEDVVDRDEGSSSKKHTVNATVLVDGSRFTFPFEVREGKPTLGVIKNWTIENALVVPVAVRIKDATTFSVGGVTAPSATTIRSRSRPRPTCSTRVSTRSTPPTWGVYRRRAGYPEGHARGIPLWCRSAHKRDD